MEPDERSATRFVRAHTAVGVAPLVPEVRLHLADDAFDLWERIEHALGRAGLPPPFWAFAWAGGQALARHVLDHPEVVTGQRVLDLASGCGVVAIAAGLAGAASVRAVDIDEFAVAAAALNAAVNNVHVDVELGDVLDTDGAGADVVLAGDVFYDRSMANRVLPFLQRAAARGATVLVGDPGRAHLPRERFEEVAVHDVPVPHDLEGRMVRRTTVWRLPHR